MRSSSSIGSARSAASCASCGDGPMSMPSAVSSSSRARPNSSTSVEPAEASAVRGRDRRLGLDVDDQPVEVGALLDTGRLDAVGHLEHRRVDRVDRDPADLLAPACLFCAARDVAAAPLDGQLHVEPALAVQRGELQVRVVHRDAGRRLDVARGHVARALLAQVHETGSSCSELTHSSLTFMTSSTTSSLTPGIVVNSCSTPSILMLVTAAPGIELTAGYAAASCPGCSRSPAPAARW